MAKTSFRAEMKTKTRARNKKGTSWTWREAYLVCSVLAAMLLGCANEWEKTGMLTLAERGSKPSYTIVLPEKPSKSQTFAALELQKYVREMTGVALPIATNATIVEGRMVAPFWFSLNAKKGYNFLKVKVATNGKEKVFGQDQYRREWAQSSMCSGQGDGRNDFISGNSCVGGISA